VIVEFALEDAEIFVENAECYDGEEGKDKNGV